MSVHKFLLSILITISLIGRASATLSDTAKAAAPKTVASWTILVYIAADNNLAEWVSYNMNDMSAGLASLVGVNVLVQCDKPTDNLTWRYKITPGGNVNVGKLSSEMGYDPATELYNSMQWAVKNYPAQHYALILWDHGSGIEDLAPGSVRTMIRGHRWLRVLSSAAERGILYDDSQNTCLTNQGLTRALQNIKKLLGKNLDLIAMDACLMAMVEVAYQMNGLVNLFVGSQQTIPNIGYPYSQFLKPLSLSPATTSTLQLAKNMVTSYSKFYTTQMPTPDYTLSAIDVMSIALIKQSIDKFMTLVAACRKINAGTTKSMILAARKASISFAMPEYIDLSSFYSNVLKQTKKIKVVQSKYQKSLSTLGAVIQDGLNKIKKVVLQNACGAVYSGAQGISIYYPRSGKIDLTYQQTIFAQNTKAWMQFIQTYR